MPRLTASALLVLALTLTACGSTVQSTSTAAGGQGLSGDGLTLGPAQGDPLGAGLAAGPGSLPGEGGGPVNGGSQAASGSAAAGGGTVGALPGGDVAGAPAAGAPAGGAGTAAGGSTARGVTAKTLTIGAALPEGAESAGKAFGISGSGSVAEKDIWAAVVRDINKAGGVLGRKLVLENRPIDIATFIANPQQTYAEICNDFRDDRKVFAAFVYVADPFLRDCFARMGSPFFAYGAFTTIPEAAYRANGGSFLYSPSSISQERVAQLHVESLMANGFTTKWDILNGGPGATPLKLGLIHADTPDQNNYYASYKRELAKVGLKFEETVTYSGGASDALASTSSAVLRFKAAGVSHVFGASAFFLRDAENQQYRPRYAYLPALGSLGAANAPAEQLNGAQTIGWAPTQDVNQPEDPGRTPGAARCDAVMRAAGLLTQGNRQDLKLMYAACDALYSFDAAMEGGQQASVAGLRRGFEGLGTRFPTALALAGATGPNRHFTVNSVRDMAYDLGCRCLKYTSRTNRS